MIFEYISIVLGLLKLCLFKALYFRRISFMLLPKVNHNFKIALKSGTRLHIGKNLRTRYNVSFRVYDEGEIIIGNNCFFNDNCSLNCQKKIVIGDNVLLGQNVMVFDHDHDYKNDIHDFVRDTVTIGNNVWIGANVTILKGVTIQDNSVIAAGTIIRNDIPSNSFVFQKKETEVKCINRN